jgi:hypothetical protein
MGKSLNIGTGLLRGKLSLFSLVNQGSADDEQDDRQNRPG